MDSELYRRFLEIREIEKCKTCLCFFGILKSLKMDFNLTEITPLLEEIKKSELHDCLECNPCIPVESYNKIIFRAKNNAKRGASS